MSTNSLEVWLKHCQVYVYLIFNKKYTFHLFHIGRLLKMTLISKLDTKMECILSWNLLTVQGSMLLELNWLFQTFFPMKRNSSVTNLQTNLQHLGWVKFISNNTIFFKIMYYVLYRQKDMLTILKKKRRIMWLWRNKESHANIQSWR